MQRPLYIAMAKIGGFVSVISGLLSDFFASDGNNTYLPKEAHK